MKYKPRNSNFDDPWLQDEFAEEVIHACRGNEPLERLKDVVAATIDSYLDEIMKEQLAERKFHAWACGENVNVVFALGENNLPSGVTDMFYTETTLSDLLNDISTQDVDEVAHASAIAGMLEAAAIKFREREQEIIKEDAEFAARWEARESGSARVQ